MNGRVTRNGAGTEIAPSERTVVAAGRVAGTSAMQAAPNSAARAGSKSKKSRAMRELIAFLPGSISSKFGISLAVNLLSVYAREVGAVPRFFLNKFSLSEAKGRSSLYPSGT